jgi:hypothetical protein
VDLRRRLLGRLHKREKREAREGYATSVKIRLEIKNIRTRISTIERDLSRLRQAFELAVPNTQRGG